VTDANLEAFKNAGGAYSAIYNAYIAPAMTNPLFRQSSLKDFEHVNQNSAV